MDLFADIPDPGFDEPARSTLLDGMNPDQIEAILHREGPALVVAGAGSGKTTVMTKRVAALIESGVSPDEILLLTFTNKAAANMVERARRYTPFADRVVAGTFHSIGLRLIKENANLFNLPAPPTIIDPSDRESSIKAIIKRLAKKNDNLPNAETIAKIHEYAVNTMRDVEDIVYEKHEQFAYALKFIEDCIAEYRTFKRQRALFDFDDLLLVWNRMLDNPKLAAEMRRRFAYVMVDEHQDSNALQCSIIAKLGGEMPNVMVVGDTAQAIYGFRGAAPRTMFAFREMWPHARLIYLNTNYRSTDEVLRVGNAVDLSMSERFERSLVAAPGARGKRPMMVTVPTNDQEAVYIADRVLENKSDGVELSEQAVLVRSLHAARMIELEFDRRSIPYRVFGGLKVSEAKHIKDFLSVVRCAVNPLDEPAWIRALSLANKVGPAMAEKVFKLVTAGVVGDGDQSAMAGAIGDPSQVVIKKTKENPDVVKIMEAWRILAKGDEKPSVALDKALVVLNDVFLAKFPDDWKRNRRQDVEAVIGMAEQYEDLTSYLSTLTLDHSVEKASNPNAMPDEEAPITISTAHSAKGLEWDVVYIPNFVKGHMPSAFARDHDGMEEEKRVLYVAVTRPRKKLVLTMPTFNFQGNRNERSDFEDTVAEHCDRSRWGAADVRRGFSFGGFDDELPVIDINDL
jgi:DNA helicase-2/ATP-dependent DNA helicase PcrA